MFGLWQKIEEKGAAAIPIRPDALSRLEWAEVSELYPELVSDECRGYDVYSDEQLISTCPFVRVGNAYKFMARMHEEDKGLNVFVDTRELVGVLCAKNYHIGHADSLFDGPLTCSCGISGCDGIDSNDPEAQKTIQNRIYMAKKTIKRILAEYGITKTDGNW